MDNEISPRIGIFQGEWPLQSQTVNCAVVLAQAGYFVDLFLYKTMEFHDIDELNQIPNVQVHLFSELDKDSVWRSPGEVRVREQDGGGISWQTILWTLIENAFALKDKTYDRYLLWRGRCDGLLPSSLLRETYRLVAGRRYKYLIGIEKVGLIWGGQVAKRLGVPHIYYSLELYTRDHPMSTFSFRQRRIKLAEEKYHKDSYATIVQDSRRAEVLFRDNGVQERNVLYVPVSLLGQPYESRSSFLRERLQIPEGRTILLYFGQLYAKRFVLELTEVAQDFPEDWCMVFHGHGDPASIRGIREADTRQRVILSLERIPSEQLQELAASADIGIVLYRASPVNDYLTAFASEKLALYLQCGLPVIAFDYPGYELIEQCRCGALIKTVQDLPQAVERILSSYEEFSSNARKCFVEYYEFSKSFNKVIEALDNLP